jgi:TolB-like protein/DNA-binding SARP family transcriptional activator
MSRGVAVPRGRLAGLLWGEHAEEPARHSLSQALTTLRSTLGPAATLLQACPEGVRLAREGLELDVDAFESAARSRQQATLQEACRLYRGAFLEGVEIHEAGFEEWQLTERYRLGELAADAMARLLDLQIAAGEADAAIATARRLVAIAPLDELAHARLIQLYGALGRRGLAEAHYARCADLLRRELDQAPSDELRAALAAARRRPPGTAVRNEQIAGTTRLPPPTDKPSVAVLAFDNLSGDPDEDYFSHGIAEDLITDLSKISGLFVIARNSAFVYRGRAVRVQDVSRDLGARYIVQGSVRKRGSRVRITIQLSDGITGGHVWAERYDRELTDIFAVQDDVTRHIVAALQVKLRCDERGRARGRGTDHIEAYELFLRGRELLQRRTRDDIALAAAVRAGDQYRPVVRHSIRGARLRLRHGIRQSMDRDAGAASRDRRSLGQTSLGARS